ncbi:5798_t:CDS:2 [Funneliformis geosporum]|nr:5798_t:CDS:2 [Funneliformis geosporum]
MLKKVTTSVKFTILNENKAACSTLKLEPNEALSAVAHERKVGVPLNLTLRHDKLKPLLSNSYTYHFLLELSTKQPPAALGTKLLLSAIFSGLVSMNLFYASSRKFYNEYLLYKTISNGHESEFDMAEDLIVPRPQALERHNEILQSTVFESKYYVVCDKQGTRKQR